MFVAEPVLIDSRTAAAPGPAPQSARALGRLLHDAAARAVRGLCESERLLTRHRRQRPAAGTVRVSARAWRRQSALICLRAGLDTEAFR
jgi:hypothetical protein